MLPMPPFKPSPGLTATHTHPHKLHACRSKLALPGLSNPWLRGATAWQATHSQSHSSSFASPSPSNYSKHLQSPFPVKAAAAIVATITKIISASTLASSLPAPAFFPAPPGLRLLPRSRRRRRCGVASAFPFLQHHRVGASAAPRSA